MKKLLVFAMIITLVLALAACGGSEGTTPPDVTDAPETEQHIHDYTDEMIPATCVAEGKLVSKCECGAIYSETVLPMTEHTLPTLDCEKDTVCTVCGALIAEKTGHALGTTEVVTEATCTSEGLERTTCTACKKVVDTVIPFAHNFSKLNVVGNKAESQCTKCSAKVQDIQVVNLHSEASSGLPYENGKVSFVGGGSGTTYGYMFPSEIIGADKAPYQVEFTLTFDRGTSTSDTMGSVVYNSGNGKHLLKYENTSFSILRQYAIEDGNGGYLTDSIDIGSMVDFAEEPIQLIRMKKGDSAKFTFVVTPKENKVEIYVNDEYKTTRDGDDKVFSSAATNMVFGDSSMRTAKIMAYTVSNISIIKEAEGDEDIVAPPTTEDNDSTPTEMIGGDGQKVVQLHNEATSGLPYENGKVSFVGGGSGTTYGYMFPSELIGADKAPYQVEFTLTFDRGTTTSNTMGSVVYNGGSGKHLLKYENASFSILRQYAIEDGNGGYLTDSIDIGSMVDFKVDPIPLIRMNKGDSAKFTFVVTPKENKVDIFVNGEYKATRTDADKVFSADATYMVFGDSSMRTAKIMAYTVSDISIVRAD